MKMTLRNKLAAGVITAGALLGVGIPAAQAACYYAAPTTASHVTYYNCQGPYVYSSYTTYRRWTCHADYDWVAETFYGYKDGLRYVYTGKTCTA